MKYIQVRRHAPKHAEGHLTEEGKRFAEETKKRLPKFNIILSSDKPRAVETAKLLTGIMPQIDKRAGTPAFTLDQEKRLHELGQNHPFGIAGVIFENQEYKKMIKEQGQQLSTLIEETFSKLPTNGCALIISHDGVMVAAEKILKKAEFGKANKTFKPLAGFQVSENGETEDVE